MSKTNIEWADAVWNPITGCTKVSPGCDNCYAERMAKRLAGRFGYPKHEPFAVTLHSDRLDQPYHWRKPRRIFVCSMGDLFHEDVPEQYIKAVFVTMGTARQHTFLVLTKRASRMNTLIRMWEKDGLTLRSGGVTLPNVWLGVTAENQKTAHERVPVLLSTPAAVRFVSVEPMLCWVDLSPYLGMPLKPGYKWAYCLCRDIEPKDRPCVVCAAKGIDWVVIGGESGPGARPMHPDWGRSLRDQCLHAKVPFLFKQWGEWCYPEQMPEDAYRAWDEEYGAVPLSEDDDPAGWPFRIGKKAAGRLLDGKVWDDYPKDRR